MRKKNKSEKQIERYGYTEKEYKKFRKNAWIVLMLYSIFYCTIYCIRLNVSAAGAKMMDELSFTKADIGNLTAVLFWAYAVGMLFGGRVTAWLGDKWTTICGISISILCNILFGFSRSIIPMYIIWAVNGLSQGVLWPAGCSIISHWWPDKSRGFAIGVACAFSGFGQALASLMVAVGFILLPSAGWKAAFFVPALLPFLTLLSLLIFAHFSPKEAGLNDYCEPDAEALAREEKTQKELEAGGKLTAYKLLFKNRTMQILMWTHLLMGIVRYGTFTWIPLYFVERYDVNISEGLFASLALPIGMGLGSFIMPTVSDRMKNKMASIPWLSFITALFVIAFVFLDPRNALQLVLIEIVLFIAGFTSYAVIGVQNVLATNVAGRMLSGTASGLFGFAGYIGAGLQAVIYGAITDHIGWDWVFYSIATLCFMVGAIFFAESLKEKHHR